ncbi:MAG: Bro-N domain-containing protein [Rhodoferax sp.]|nr:Bro-N domain-containing protein [Rhodoferax sp.]
MQTPHLHTEPANHIAVFQETTIRRVWHNEEWWFAIVDVVAVLTDSVQPEGYVKDLRRRDPELAKGWGQIATPLRLETAGGAQRVNCANTEGLFRIIQSIPSPKAEPFKRWLAQVGYERVQEIENPELASARARALYPGQGLPASVD